MRMWYEPEFDLDAFLESMEQGQERQASVPAWKRVEEHQDMRRLREQLMWYPEDLEERRKT